MKTNEHAVYSNLITLTAGRRKATNFEVKSKTNFPTRKKTAKAKEVNRKSRIAENE